MSKFVVRRLADRIFYIITDDQLDSSGNYKELPIKVYGFLRVDDNSVKKVFYSSVHHDVTPELDFLREEARKRVYD